MLAPGKLQVLADAAAPLAATGVLSCGMGSGVCEWGGKRDGGSAAVVPRSHKAELLDAAF